MIGIDPDLHKSGLAIYDTHERNWIFHKAVPNAILLQTVLDLCPVDDSFVYIEAGWLNKKSNFRGGNYREAQAKARNVGENAGAGKFIVALFENAKYETFQIKPLQKGMLKTVKGSWTVAGRRYIERSTGIKGQLNDDARDAIYIADHFKAGHALVEIPLPIKTKKPRGNTTKSNAEGTTDKSRVKSRTDSKETGKRKI